MGGRAAECTGLENRRVSVPHKQFESDDWGGKALQGKKARGALYTPRHYSHGSPIGREIIERIGDE